MKKEEKTALTRKKIIAAAIEEFATRGYRGFVINDLCKKHGISKGILYHNFKGKDALYLECVRLSFQKALKAIRGGDEVPSLGDYIKRRHAFFREHPHYSRIFFEALIATPESMQVAIQVEKEELHALNREVYQQLLAHSQLKQGISSEMAMQYLDLLQQLFRSHYLHASETQATPFLAEEYEEKIFHFLEMALYGLFKD